MFYRPWQIKKNDPARSAALSAALGMPRLVSDVLCARGLDTPEKAQILCGDGAELSDPMLLSGMQAAVERIHRAIDEGERIVVFGDYDVDGVTATALLYTYLDTTGAEVYYKLPNREDDGYGLSIKAVEQLAAKDVDLIITVDNGISAKEAVEHANTLGIDVVVTDHHMPPAELPPACAVVDPLLPYDTSPCKTLSGVGVAFKLAAALDGCPPEELLPFYGDFAALGTIADIMLLEGENRRIVKQGLALLQQTDRPGIAALMESCGLAEKELTAENVSFSISPRLNAAGRMHQAEAALELLLCEDPEEAPLLAQGLEEQNVERQKTEQQILQNVLADIAADKTYGTDRVIVVWGRGYHPGVIGIVASRIVERFGKPAIVISLDENGEGKGSGRSIAGFSLYRAIAECAPLLIRFGGHALAAGLSVREENLPQLRRRMNEWAAREYPVIQRPALVLDAAVRLAEISEPDVAALSVLAPFGNGNPSPVFLVEHAVIDAVYPLSDGKHTRLRLRQGSGVLYAALFGVAPETFGYCVGQAVDAAIQLSVFEGRNGPMISARMVELRPAGLGNEYLEGTTLYEALICGAALSETECALVRPCRADTVALYRAVGAAPQGIPAEDLRPLFAKLGTQNAGKILVSLEALRELSLVEKQQTPQGVRWKLVPATGKKDLASAPILKRLGTAQ